MNHNDESQRELNKPHANVVRALQPTEHVVEITLPDDHIEIKKRGLLIHIRMTTTTAQDLYESLFGLQSTVQPFTRD